MLYEVITQIEQRFFFISCSHAIFYRQYAVLALIIDTGDRRESVHLDMVFEQLVNINIADAVTVCDKESIACDILFNHFDAGARLRIDSGIHERDIPIVFEFIEIFDMVITHG